MSFLRHLGLPTALVVAACSSDPDDDAKFDYGKDEMRSAIEGTWEGASPTAGGGTAPVTLTLVYAAPDVKTLCGNRVLGHDVSAVAPRCIDMSSVNLRGTMTMRFGETDAPREAPLRGTFDVMSLRFDGRGMVAADVDGQRLEATLANDVLDGSLFAAPDRAGKVGFSLRRRP